MLYGDEPINELHIEIDNRCFKLLALHQPMATDLRAIVAAVKINTDLERVGDLAVNIAEAAQALRHASAGEEADRHPADGRHRAGDAPRRARLVRAARHGPRRTRCSTRTTGWTRLKTQIFRELLTYMLRGPGHGRAGARPDSDLPAPRADRRSRHQHRRGRDLHGVGARRAPSRAEPANLTINRVGQSIRQIRQIGHLQRLQSRNQQSLN